MMTLKRVVVLAPHTDDGELAAGASLSRWVSEGLEVHYVAFSACQSAVPDGWPEDVLVDEVKRATSYLGIPPSNLRILDFEVRLFARDRQRLLQAMVDLDKELRPDLVLMPSVRDLHQDHNVVAMEGLRAFKHRSVLAYEIPWNNITFTTSCFVSVTQADVDRKLGAVQCYRSQAGRVYAAADFLEAQLRFRGVQAGIRYAESFDVVRWVLR